MNYAVRRGLRPRTIEEENTTKGDDGTFALFEVVTSEREREEKRDKGGHTYTRPRATLPFFTSFTFPPLDLPPEFLHHHPAAASATSSPRQSLRRHFSRADWNFHTDTSAVLVYVRNKWNVAHHPRLSPSSSVSSVFRFGVSSLSSLPSLFFLSYVSGRLVYSFVLPSTFFCLFLVSVIIDDFVFLLFTCFVLVFEHEVANDNHPRWMRVDISRVHFAFLPFHVDCLCRFLEWRTLEHVIDAEPARVTCCRGCVLCRKFEAPASLSLCLSLCL